MNAVDYLVILVGLAAIAWVVWYFLVYQAPSATAKTSESGSQEISVTVKGGYDPSVIRVQAGKPIRLRLNRQETSSCSEEIVFPDFGIRKFLPAFEETVLDLGPQKPGSYDFMCGMSMLHGKLVAE